MKSKQPVAQRFGEQVEAVDLIRHAKRYALILDVLNGQADAP
jgi:hypothetical protein